mmetsp:Transcript_11257/g.18111  ORF Transcript_11257/g.18111 Transcript_11257/m.18111 type:complete len:132 (+) Transcript_11257:168-563(+)
MRALHAHFFSFATDLPSRCKRKLPHQAAASLSHSYQTVQNCAQPVCFSSPCSHTTMPVIVTVVPGSRNPVSATVRVRVPKTETKGDERADHNCHYLPRSEPPPGSHRLWQHVDARRVQKCSAAEQQTQGDR